MKTSGLSVFFNSIHVRLGNASSDTEMEKKLNYALQLSLDKLSKFEEEFAIRQVERAIESGWTGVVFTGTERDYQEWLNLKYNGSNRKTDAKPDESSAGIKSIVFGKQS